MTIMLDKWHDDIRHERVAVLRPAVEVRPATPEEAADCSPWCHASGETAYEVTAFADGGNTHAPEVLSVLRTLFSQTPQPALLIYAHRGQKIESMMPLLPSLLFALDYRGATRTLRIPQDAGSAETALQIRRFAASQVPDDGVAVLVVDRQDRLAPTGRLTPETVEISVLWRELRTLARIPGRDPVAASERAAR